MLLRFTDLYHNYLLYKFLRAVLMIKLKNTLWDDIAERVLHQTLSMFKRYLDILLFSYLWMSIHEWKTKKHAMQLNQINMIQNCSKDIICRGADIGKTGKTVVLSRVGGYRSKTFSFKLAFNYSWFCLIIIHGHWQNLKNKIQLPSWNNFF